MTYGVTFLLAGSAVVVHSAALILAVRAARRLRSPPVLAIIAGAIVLMLGRRIIAAASAAAGVDLPALLIAKESAGLVVSALLVTALVLLLTGRLPPAPEAPAEVTDQPAADDAITAREEERELLSYDLHDGLAQNVLAAQMHLEAFTAAREKDSERAQRELDVARRRVGEAVADVHRLIANLTLIVPEDVSLGEAVDRFLSRLGETQGWRFEFSDALEGRRFAPEIEAMTCRVVEEALTNAAKHARTDRVAVSLCVKEASLIASVRDWGNGFDPEQAQWNPRRLGVKGMCGRARLMGGSCSIESRPGKGAVVTFRVPIETEASARS